MIFFLLSDVAAFMYCQLALLPTHIITSSVPPLSLIVGRRRKQGLIFLSDVDLDLTFVSSGGSKAVNLR